MYSKASRWAKDQNSAKTQEKVSQSWTLSKKFASAIIQTSEISSDYSDNFTIISQLLFIAIYLILIENFVDDHNTTNYDKLARALAFYTQ